MYYRNNYNYVNYTKEKLATVTNSVLNWASCNTRRINTAFKSNCNTCKRIRMLILGIPDYLYPLQTLQWVHL